MFDLESYLEICVSLDLKNKYDTQIRRIAGADLRPAAVLQSVLFQKETRMDEGRGPSTGPWVQRGHGGSAIKGPIRQSRRN